MSLSQFSSNPVSTLPWEWPLYHTVHSYISSASKFPQFHCIWDEIQVASRACQTVCTPLVARTSSPAISRHILYAPVMLIYILQIFHVALCLKSWCEYFLLWEGFSHPHRFEQLPPHFKNAILDIFPTSSFMLCSHKLCGCCFLVFFLFILSTLSLYSSPYSPHGHQVLTPGLYIHAATLQSVCCS